MTGVQTCALPISGRMKLGIPQDKDLKGHIFVSSGLGGMSGAQGKAAKIAGGVGVIAEVDRSRINTRLEQGWVDELYEDLGELFAATKKYLDTGKATALAYHGNIIDLLEYAVENNIHIELLSDQTSCHAAYDGGYCPQGLTFDKRTEMLYGDRKSVV